MEINAMKNKIDQLERLVLSQSKEIDILKHIVMNQPPSLHANNHHNENAYINSNRNHHHQNNNARNNQQSYESRRDYQSQQSSPQQQRRPTTMTYQPYVMNPHVHPSSAIPPVTRAFTVGPDDRLRYKGEIRLAPELVNFTVGPNECLRYKSECSETPKDDPHYWSNRVEDKRKGGASTNNDDSDTDDDHDRNREDRDDSSPNSSSSERSEARNMTDRQGLIEPAPAYIEPMQKFEVKAEIVKSEKIKSEPCASVNFKRIKTEGPKTEPQPCALSQPQLKQEPQPQLKQEPQPQPKQEPQPQPKQEPQPQHQLRQPRLLHQQSWGQTEPRAQQAWPWTTNKAVLPESLQKMFQKSPFQ